MLVNAESWIQGGPAASPRVLSLGLQRVNAGVGGISKHRDTSQTLN